MKARKWLLFTWAFSLFVFSEGASTRAVQNAMLNQRDNLGNGEPVRVNAIMRGDIDHDDHDDGSDDNNNNNNNLANRNPLLNRFRCLNMADVVRPFHVRSRRQPARPGAASTCRKTMKIKLEVRLVSLYGLVGLAAIARRLGPNFRDILLDDPQRVPRVAMAVGVERRVFMVNRPRLFEDEGYSSGEDGIQH